LYDRQHQYTPTRVPVPATADYGTSITSARLHARRAVPVMSTCSLTQQYGMSLSSPTTAYLAEIEREIAVANTKCSVSLLQNVGLNTLYISDRNSKSMLQSYVHSYAQRPKVYMARTKGTVQREKEREKEDSDSDHCKVRPSKKGRKRHSPRPSQYICYFCDKVNKQRTNHKRHMVMKHACRLDGTKATDEDLAQARAWASKERVDRSQQFKSKEYVSSDSDSDSDDMSESSTSSRHSVRSPRHQSRKADRSSSEQSSRSPSPAPAAPKVRKVRFELDEPLAEGGESSRARKKPDKPTPSTSKTAGQVPSLMDMNLTTTKPKKGAATSQAAPRSQKSAATVHSEVHAAPKPSTTKKGAKSSAVPEAQPEAATPQKRLVIEAPRLEHMVDIAKKAVQNLKDRKKLPEPEPYRPTFGPSPSQPKVKGSSIITGKGKAATTASTTAESCIQGCRRPYAGPDT